MKKGTFTTQGIPKWADEWVAKLTTTEKFALMSAADELLFDELVGFLSANIAFIIQNMDEEVKSATFGLSRPFSPEEEAKVRKDNPWAEEE